MAEYSINIEEVYSQTGLEGIAQAAAGALRDLASQAQSLGEQVAAQQYQQIQTSFASGTEAAGAAGTIPQGEMAQIRGMLTNVFADINRMSGALRQQLGQAAVQEISGLQSSLRQGGVLLPQQGIRTAVQQGQQLPPAGRGLVPQINQQAGLGQQAQSELQAAARKQAEDQLEATQQRAMALEMLAAGHDWAQAKAADVRWGMELGAQVEEELALSRDYAQAKARYTRATTEVEAAVQEELASTSAFAVTQARVTRAKAEIAARTQEELASTGQYAAAQARATRAKAEIDAAVQQDLATTGQYALAQAESARAKALITAQTQAELARTGEYATAQADATRAKQQIAARVQEELGADTRYAESTAALAAARDRVAGLTAVAQNTPERNTENVNRRVAEDTLRQQQQLQYNSTLLAEPGQAGIRLQAAQRSSAEAVERQRNIILEQTRMEDVNLQASATLARLKEERAAAERGVRVGVTRESGEELASYQGRIAAMENAETLTRRAAQQRAILANENGELDAVIQERTATAELNRAISLRLREQRGTGPGTVLEGGSLFQRLQAQLRARNNPEQVIDPQQYMGLGQFVGSRALTTAGFAFSGAAIYTAVRGIREMVQEADQLDLVMTQVRAQFTALGQGSQFNEFRQGILSIARDTGTASTEVARIGILMKGAFQDTPTALEATRQTAEAMKVTGIEGGDAVNTFIALAKTFDVTVQDVSDKALGLQDRFGVMAKEIIQGASAIAPIARQVGLSMNELMSLVAAAAQVTGRPAQSVAEGLGRILPQLQKQAAPIIELYSQVPALQSRLGTVQQAFASGNEGQVLTGLVRDWHLLTQAQQENVLSLLGGRREAQVLADALQDPDRLIQELDGHFNDAGRTQKAWNDLQQSLVQSLSRMRQELRQVGDDLARLGALDAFKVLAGGAEGFLRILGLVLGGLADLNNLTHGALGEVVGITVAFLALEKAMAAVAALSTLRAGVGAALGRVAGTAAAVEGAEAAAVGGAAGPGGGFSGGGELPFYAALYAGQGRGRGAAFLSRFGAIGQMNVPGLGWAPGLPGFGGAAGVGSAAGIGGSGWLASGSASLGAATAGVGIADMLAIRQAQTEFSRLRSSELGASKINEDQFRSETLQQLLANQDIYSQGAGRGQGYSIPQRAVGAVTTGGMSELLRRALPGRESAADFLTGRVGIGDFFRGRTQAQNQQRDAIRRETVSEFDVLAAAGALSGTGMSQQQIDDLKKRVDASGGSGGAGKDAQKAIAEAAQHNGRQVRDLVTHAKGAQRARDQAAAGQSTDEIVNIQDIQELVSVGSVSITEGITQIRDQLDNLRKAGGESTTQPELHKQYLQGLKALQQMEANLATKQISFAQQIGQALGQNPIAAVEPALESQLGILGNPNQNQEDQIRALRQHGENVPANNILNELQRHEIDPEAAAQIGQQALTIQHQALLDAMQHATSQADALKIGETGAQVDPQTEAVLVEAARQMYGQNAADELKKILDSGVHLTDAERLQQQQAALQEQLSGIQAQYAGQRDPAAQAAAAAQTAQAQMTAAQARTDPGRQQAIYDAQAAQAQAANQSQDVETQKRTAHYAMLQAGMNRDPLAVAQSRRQEAIDNLNEAKAQNRGQAAIDQAQQQVDQANQSVDDANEGIARARIELTKAQHPDDAIAQARAAQQEADLAAKNAHGKAAELAAAAQRAAADRSMRDAMFAITQSRVKLLQTQAQVAGDDIQAAQYGVQEAQNALDRAIKEGASEDVINNLTGAVDQAKGQLRDTTIQSKEDVIQFNLDMKRITVGQAIEQLQALLSIANPKEQMDLLRRIQQLRNQAGQDLQFNIPSEIKLPTLYEVRRYEQTPAGQGYNDNRQVSVTMHVNNGMDQASATRWLSDTVGRTPRVIVGNRRV